MEIQNVLVSLLSSLKEEGYARKELRTLEPIVIYLVLEGLVKEDATEGMMERF